MVSYTAESRNGAGKMPMQPFWPDKAFWIAWWALVLVSNKCFWHGRAGDFDIGLKVAEYVAYKSR